MRKFMSVILAWMMFLTPALAMAASPAEMLDAAWNNGATISTNVSFQVADLPLPEEAKQVINDLEQALGFRTAANPEGKAEAALTLQGKDAITIGFEPVGDNLYLHLPLITPTTMAFSGEEFLITLERIVLMAAEAAGASESEIAQIKAFFDGGLETAAESMVESMDAMEFQMPEIDTTALMMQLMANVQPLQQVEQPADCDPVSSGVIINITPELVASLMQIFCDTIAVNPSLMASFAQAGMEIDAQALKEAPAAAAEEFKAAYGVVPVTVLLDDAGNVAYGDIALKPVNGGVTSTLSYARHTTEKGIQHALNIMENGEGVCLMAGDYSSENRTEYALSVFLLSGGKKSGVRMDCGFVQTRDRNAQQAQDVTTLYAMIPANDVVSQLINLTLKIDQQAAMTADGAKCDTAIVLGCDLLGGDIFTINVNTVADKTVLPSLTDTAAVHPGKMTEAEFAGFVEAVPNNALTVIFTAMQMLPESVLMLMMN